MATTQAPPNPKLCCNAYLTPGTCLGPEMPLNCQQSYAHCANPVAPKGCPLLVRPPEGLTTTFPPYVLSPLSINYPALPSSHRPSA